MAVAPIAVVDASTLIKCINDTLWKDDILVPNLEIALITYIYPVINHHRVKPVYVYAVWRLTIPLRI